MTATPITIEDTDRVEFKINGVTFDVDPFDALDDVIRAADHPHEFTANECMACKSMVPLNSMRAVEVDGEAIEKPTCPACGSHEVKYSPAWADAIASHLKQQFGVTCSRARAVEYRAALIHVTENQKKST